MRPVLVITHLRDPHLGLVGEALTEAEIPIVHRNVFSDKALPPMAEIAGISSLGGQMSVTNLAQYPFLAAELRLLKGAVRMRLPTIGLCLGAQLLATATGGRIDRMDRPYIGWPRLTFETRVRDDPLFHDLPSNIQVIKWHLDAIDPPPSAAILASTGGPGCAIFRTGPQAWGSQMHIETTPEMLFERWLVDPVEQGSLLAAGLKPDAFISMSTQLLPQQMTAMRLVFQRFAEQVTHERV